MNRFQSLFVFVLAIFWSFQLEQVSGCFITNCPPAGKRSVDFSNHNNVRKECTRCGPAGSGRCYGTNICCSPLFGCVMGGKISRICQLEAYNPHLCVNPGQECAAGKGVCALNSTCCTSESCFVDKSCSISANNNRQHQLFSTQQQQQALNNNQILETNSIELEF